MTIAQQKIALSQKLLLVKNPEVLKRIENILNEELATSWEELPKRIQKELQASISELESGIQIPNEDVLSRARVLWHSKSTGQKKPKRVIKK